MRSNRVAAAGITLIEILVVTAIVAILVGVVMPVIVRAKNSGRSVDNISAMRQLGQAAAMYHDQTGIWPRRTADVVASGFAPPAICGSKLDPNPTGFGNIMFTSSDFVERGSRAKAVAYKDSYVGLEHLRIPESDFQKFVTDRPGGGWLIDFTPTMRNPIMNPMTWEGKYRRLLLDGAVVMRSIYRFPCTLDGKPVPCARPTMLFVDRHEDLEKWVISFSE